MSLKVTVTAPEEPEPGNVPGVNPMLVVLALSSVGFGATRLVSRKSNR